MDNTELELMLRETAPQPPLPAGLAGHRERILADARPRRARRLRAWTAGVAASVLLFGGGSAAMAAGGMETPWGWVADNVFSVANDAELCFAGFTVSFADGVDEDSAIARETRAFVGALDLETLDTVQMEAENRESYLTAQDENGDVNPITMSDAQAKQMAVWRVASNLMWEHLEAKGYDPNLVGFGMTTEGCDL